MRVAIVHDSLIQAGGAERVVAALHRLYPDAPIHVAAYLDDAMPGIFRAMDVRSTFMQRLPGLQSHFRKYLLAYPLAFSRIDVSGADLVISSSAGWAHGVKTRPGQIHLCYCHTPPRWLWEQERYLAREAVHPAMKQALAPVLHGLRERDKRLAMRPTRYIANSTHTAGKIERCYGRAAEVIYPPVEINRFRAAATGRPGAYYLIVSRLLSYKRIDLAVEAFTRLRLPLKIAGVGPAMEALRRQAGPTIEFLGRVPESALPDLVAGCRAFLFPGEEDFGIAPIEAMGAGRPVIAYAAGGALETVIDGETGVLMREQTVEALIDAVRRLESLHLDPAGIERHAARFDEAAFQQQIIDLVRRAMGGELSR